MRLELRTWSERRRRQTPGHIMEAPDRLGGAAKARACRDSPSPNTCAGLLTRDAGASPACTVARPRDCSTRRACLLPDCTVTSLALTHSVLSRWIESLMLLQRSGPARVRHSESVQVAANAQAWTCSSSAPPFARSVGLVGPAACGIAADACGHRSIGATRRTPADTVPTHHLQVRQERDLCDVQWAFCLPVAEIAAQRDPCKPVQLQLVPGRLRRGIHRDHALQCSVTVGRYGSKAECVQWRYSPTWGRWGAPTRGSTLRECIRGRAGDPAGKRRRQRSIWCRTACAAGTRKL